MEIATIIGICATVASTVSFVPQAWKIIKSRQTHDISTAMYAVTVIGFGLWMAYGVVLVQWPLILTNGLCLVLSAFILTMKILPRREKNAIADALDPST